MLFLATYFVNQKHIKITPRKLTKTTFILHIFDLFLGSRGESQPDLFVHPIFYEFRSLPTIFDIPQIPPSVECAGLHVPSHLATKPRNQQFLHKKPAWNQTKVSGKAVSRTLHTAPQQITNLGSNLGPGQVWTKGRLGIADPDTTSGGRKQILRIKGGGGIRNNYEELDSRSFR